MTKLDRYILKQFIGPFLVLFSIIQFVLVITFLYQKIDEFSNKGLDGSNFAELFYYGAVSLIPMGLPIAMLLATIMVFGGLGERYELAAIKSTGTSLRRSMRSILIFSIILTVFSYWYSETISTQSQVKFRNMIINIISSKQTLELEPGVFISNIPENAMKIGSKYIDSSGLEHFDDVLIYQNSNKSRDKTTIKAKYGKVLPKDHPYYLKIQLLDGSFYKEIRQGKSRVELRRQEHQRMHFDTLTLNINIKELVAQDFDKEAGQHREMLNKEELDAYIDTLTQKKEGFLNRNANEHYVTFVKNFKAIDSTNVKPQNKMFFLSLDSINSHQKVRILADVERKIESRLSSFESKEKAYNSRFKTLIKYQITHPSRITKALMIFILCIAGTALGSLIRKGGLGIPLIVGVAVFVSYHSLNIMFESLVKRGALLPELGIWIPTLIMGPLAFFFLYKANKDLKVIDTSRISLFKIYISIVNYFRALFEMERLAQSQASELSLKKTMKHYFNELMEVEEIMNSKEKVSNSTSKSFWERLMGDEEK